MTEPEPEDIKLAFTKPELAALYQIVTTLPRQLDPTDAEGRQVIGPALQFEQTLLGLRVKLGTAMLAASASEPVPVADAPVPAENGAGPAEPVPVSLKPKPNRAARRAKAKA